MTEKESEKDTTTAAIKAGANVKVYSNRWLAKVVEEKPPFPDELFDTTFAPERLTSIVKALKDATEKEVNESSRLLADNYIYSLQLTSFKAPPSHVHLSRVEIEHSLLADDAEVCLFVKDLKRGRRPDYDSTIQHYEKLLRTNKVKQNITVIPLSQLYNEYTTFELRRKLTFLYDKFVAETSVAAAVNGFLGTKLLNKGRIAFPVDFNNLAESLDIALRTVTYKHLQRGVTSSIPIGRHNMTNETIADNVIDVIGQVQDFHPGGYANVYKLLLRPQHNIPVIVPIYTAQVEKAKDASATGTTATTEQEAETFDDAAAAKLIQKRTFPYGSIVPDEHLVDDDENVHAEPAIKHRLGDGHRQLGSGGGDGGVRRTGGLASGRAQANNQTPNAKSKQQQVASPRARGNLSSNVKNLNNSGNVRPSRNLNGVSAASKGAISKVKRPNLNRNAVLNMLRNNSDNGLNDRFSRNNDLALADLGSSSSNYNRGSGTGGLFDDFVRRGNNDSFDLGFTRRSNLNSSTEEFARNLALGLDLRLGGSSFGSNNGNSYGGGRNYSNGNRF